jgi:hypothetical protein
MLAYYESYFFFKDFLRPSVQIMLIQLMHTNNHKRDKIRRHRNNTSN